MFKDTLSCKEQKALTKDKWLKREGVDDLKNKKSRVRQFSSTRMSRSRLLFIFLSAVLSRMAFPWGLSCFQEAIAALNITASRQHTTALRRTFISPCYLLKIEGNLSQMLPPLQRLLRSHWIDLFRMPMPTPIRDKGEWNSQDQLDQSWLTAGKWG